MSRLVLKKQNWFFEGKEDEEDVILVLHRHWLTVGTKITIVMILAIVPFIVLIVLGPLIVKFNLIGLFSFGLVAYFMMLWYALFHIITMYMLDNWVVTTKRIIDSEQRGFFNRVVAELHLEKIQDVSYRVEGLFPTFFNYGIVEIQTAGVEHKFFFNEVPNPQRVKDIIMELILEEEDAENHNSDGVSAHHGHILVKSDGVPTPLITESHDDEEQTIQPEDLRGTEIAEITTDDTENIQMSDNHNQDKDEYNEI